VQPFLSRLNILFHNSSGTGGHGNLLEHGHDSNKRQADHTNGSPLQGSQKDSHCALYVLRSWSVPILLHMTTSSNVSRRPPFAPQMTSSTSSRSLCTPSMDAPVTSASLLARTAISRRTSMAQSTRWTRCACPCISVSFRSGPHCGGNLRC
jgi:hypothetical protein